MDNLELLNDEEILRTNTAIEALKSFHGFSS